MKRIDMHVHMVGTARGGHGCWLRITPGKTPLYYFMLRHIGLPISSLNSPGFDDLFAENLLKHIRTSSLDAVVLLAQEEVYDDDGNLLEGWGNAHVPNDYVLELAREHPEFLPAVSIHPARPGALDELNRCLEAGAVMMKYLPNCQNINCNDPRFTKFWNQMAEAKLPLLTHTGGEHTLQVVRPEYANPRTMTLPLECGVTVIAAHAATRSGLRDPDYLPELTKMIENYPNLYADISALNLPFRSYALRDCLNGGLTERLVHGSDFPVPVHALWARLRGLLSPAEARRCARCASPIERDYQLKKAMGFPAETFTRINQLLRLPASSS
jgi:hypothetical protein